MTKSMVACALAIAAWGLLGPNCSMAATKDDKPKGALHINVNGKWLKCIPGSDAPVTKGPDKGKTMCIAPGGTPIGPGWGDDEQLAPVPPKPEKPNKK